jgi:carbon storage regulator
VLVLSRKIEEALVFPSLGISIVVVDIERGKVRIGICAPDDVKVYREELWNRIDQYEVQKKPSRGGAEK